MIIVDYSSFLVQISGLLAPVFTKSEIMTEYEHQMENGQNRMAVYEVSDLPPLPSFLPFSSLHL